MENLILKIEICEPKRLCADKPRPLQPHYSRDDLRPRWTKFWRDGSYRRGDVALGASVYLTTSDALTSPARPLKTFALATTDIIADGPLLGNPCWGWVAPLPEAGDAQT